MLAIKPYLEVLKNANFAKLWVSQLCSQLTNYVLSFAVLLQAFKLTQSSLAVSLILVAFGLATIFFGSIAGVYADRFDRRKLLIVTNFAQAFVVLFFLPYHDTFWVLAIITFLYSSLNQFYLPSEAPSIPNVVPKEHLLIANGFFGFTASSSMIIGFTLAGPLTLWFGSSAPFWTAFVLLSIAGIASLMLPSLRPEPHPFENQFVNNVWSEFKEGIAHLWKSTSIHFAFISLICAQIFNGMLITLSPAYVEHVLKLNLEKGTLYMIAPMAVGILVGSLIIGWEGQYLSRKSQIRLGFTGIGVFTLLIALLINEETKWFYPPLAFILGFSSTHIFAPSHSMIQSRVHENLRGRFYGSLFLMLQLAATLPTFIIGILADKLGVPTILGGLGLVMLAYSTVVSSQKDPGDIPTPITPLSS
jgi:MFS family permease